ncbi:MAG: PAS domain S-box protein [Caldilinea sp. CFX5]|nr:PAS domain S-box protein [Caldilinea sp. CFX5]
MHCLPNPASLAASPMNRPPWLRYSVAIVTVTLTLLFTIWATPIRTGTPFLFFFLAVTISAWYGGRGPGLLATFLSAFAVMVWAFPPYGALAFSPWHYGQLAGFFAVAGAICWLLSALQMARRREEELRMAQELSLQSLRKSEERYRTLVEAAPVFVWHANAAGDLTYSSDRFYEYTGRRADDCNGWNWQMQQVIHPDDLAGLATRWRQSLTTGQRFEMEVRLRGADGLYRWHLNRMLPVVDDAGVSSGWVGTSTNIDDRRRAEEALRAAHVQIRNILESITDCFYTLDHEWRYTYINVQAERYFGRARTEMLGQVVWAFFPAMAGTIFEEQFRRATTEGEAVHFEVLSPVTHQWIEVHAYPSADGLSVYFHNISERKCAEARQRFLADLGETMVGLQDPDELLWLVVQQLGEFLGVSRCFFTEVDRAQGQIFIHRNYHQADFASLAGVYPMTDFDPQSVAAHEAGRALALPDIPPDALPSTVGPTRYTATQIRAMVSAPLLRDGQWVAALIVSDHNPRAWSEAEVGLIQTVAERAWLAVENRRLFQETKSLLAQVHQLNLTLEQRVAERTAQLAQKNVELERSNRELEKFAYVASHDLRSPLRAIDNLSQWIDEDAGRLLPDASKEHLAKMRGRVRRMDQLLDDLLAYSRIGRFAYNVETVDVKQLVQEIMILLNAPPTFQVTLAEALPVFRTQRVPFATVLRNLIGNAIKHHHRPDGHVHIAAHDEGAWLHFVVSDDGPGIDPQFHGKIFEIFQTLQPRDKVEGSGMGLAIVKKAVEIVGGTITVESHVGAGATFRFTWPKQHITENQED